MYIKIYDIIIQTYPTTYIFFTYVYASGKCLLLILHSRLEKCYQIAINTHNPRAILQIS